MLPHLNHAQAPQIPGPVALRTALLRRTLYMVLLCRLTHLLTGSGQAWVVLNQYTVQQENGQFMCAFPAFRDFSLYLDIKPSEVAS